MHPPGCFFMVQLSPAFRLQAPSNAGRSCKEFGQSRAHGLSKDSGTRTGLAPCSATGGSQRGPSNKAAYLYVFFRLPGVCHSFSCTAQLWSFLKIRMHRFSFLCYSFRFWVALSLLRRNPLPSKCRATISNSSGSSPVFCLISFFLTMSRLHFCGAPVASTQSLPR